MTATLVAEPWPLVGRRPHLATFSSALRDPAFDAFVVHGPSGVGKTRLADECLQIAEGAGFQCGRAAASAEAQSMPLAAIAHLIPADLTRPAASTADRLDSVELFSRVRQALEELGGGSRLVLVVDDLHELDVTSATLLRQLVVARVVFLVGTVLTGRRASTSVTALWRDDRCLRVDLDDLPRDSVETLLHHALGAPVDGPAAHALWSTSQGNVLFLRELVLGAEQSGALIDEGGVWRLAQPLTSTRRLDELVTGRVANIEESGQRALEMLALCGPLEPESFDGVAEAHVLEALEEAGLVTVTITGRRRLLALVHPVHREVLRSRVPKLRQRSMLLRQATLVEQWGARRRDDPLRIATWRLEATGQADADLLVRAARLAHLAHDYPLVVRLAGAAQLDRPTVDAGLLLGKALFELGSFFEAEVELSRAGRLAEGDDDVVAVAAAQAANLVWGLLRPDDALAVNQAATARVVSDDAQAELIAQHAWILLFDGQPARARQLLSSLPGAAAARPALVATLVESYAQTLSGHPVGGLELARRGSDAHAELGDELWLDHPASHVLAQVAALTDAGRLVDAADCAAAGYRQASEAHVPLLQIRFAFHVGRIALLAGRARTARRWYREAVARSVATGFPGPRSFALSGLAVAESLLGDVEAAGAAIEAMADGRSFWFLKPERDLGYAWWLVASGDVEEARRVLSAAADTAIETGHLTSASWLLHDIARLGEPAAVAERLDGLAETCDSELVSARAAHARALAAVDPDALERVADRMEAMGAVLFASEAASAASLALVQQGSARRSASLGARAVALVAQCEGARTPALVLSAAAARLTARERQVAAMAATGMPSREIGSRLFLSVRTVNNHLQRVYAKLGVADREALRTSLDQIEPEGEP